MTDNQDVDGAFREQHPGHDVSQHNLARSSSGMPLLSLGRGTRAGRREWGRDLGQDVLRG